MKDSLAQLWLWLGDQFRRRPVAVTGMLLGAVIFVGVFSYVLWEQDHTNAKIRAVQSAFCNGKAPYTKAIEENCHKLLDQLLRNPTTEQADRLREIVKESP